MILKMHVDEPSQHIVSASVHIAWKSYFANIVLLDVCVYTCRLQKINGEGNRKCQEKYACVYTFENENYFIRNICL